MKPGAISLDPSSTALLITVETSVVDTARLGTLTDLGKAGSLGMFVLFVQVLMESLWFLRVKLA